MHFLLLFLLPPPQLLLHSVHFPQLSNGGEERKGSKIGVKLLRMVFLLSPSPLALPLVLAAVAHLVVAALLPINLVVLVVADKAVS